MSIQPEHVELTNPHPHMGNVADAVALVQSTAQRAILPRRLDEGIYAGGWQELPEVWHDPR